MKKTVWMILVIIVVEILVLFLIQERKFIQSPIINVEQIPTLTPEPTEEIVKIVKIEKVKEITTPTPTPTPTEVWGISKQIGDKTWTIKIGEDATMATAKEIFDALNEYRKVHGSQMLTWNEKLGNYAQERAKYLNEIKSVDQHKGFNDYVENQDGFNKLGFTSLGENISYGYRLNGVHIIEWMYAGDEPHNKNQLDNRWNYVGIGVDGLATSLIFGTGKF